jgi:hypothetical protein
VNISQVSTLILPRILSVLLDSESDEDWNDGKEEEDRTGAENTWAYHSFFVMKRLKQHQSWLYSTFGINCSRKCQ